MRGNGTGSTLAPLRSLYERAARVTRATVRDAIDDDLAGEAAKMAYYFFLSLFPLVLVVFAMTGLVGGNEAFARMTAALERPVPDYAWQFVRDLIQEVTSHRRPGVLSLGIMLTLWAASNGIAALTGGLNTIYDVGEARPWWKRRLIAVAVLTVGVVLLVLAAAALIAGLEWARRQGLAGVWATVRWPIAFVLLTGTVWLAYHHLPARDQRHARTHTLAGAIAATALWVLATWLFGFYVTHFGRYGRVYGAVGAVIVLLIWFYLTAFAILAGGELGAQLERERGHGPLRKSTKRARAAGANRRDVGRTLPFRSIRAEPRNDYRRR